MSMPDTGRISQRPVDILGGPANSKFRSTASSSFACASVDTRGGPYQQGQDRTVRWQCQDVCLMAVHTSTYPEADPDTHLLPGLGNYGTGWKHVTILLSL
jgi:hypothetical protein